jgi:hypothetical protein
VWVQEFAQNTPRERLARVRPVARKDPRNLTMLYATALQANSRIDRVQRRFPMMKQEY